ncbi:MAG TPA: hemerythrin domain-containing protein [Albitalea sp.]|uniref:hemerythrin domain-containing protein n=1 Tax=Piscinibacter sp. TaxID=1903157 RepID=UPI002ED4994C
MHHDIVVLLDEDHGRLKELSRQVRACPHPAKALNRFDEFALVLGGHVNAVRKVVYPGLKAIGWKDVSSVLLLGHVKLTRQFAELLTLRKPSGVFAEGLNDLLDATGHVIERERRDLLPLLRDHLTPAVRVAMAVDAAQYLAHLERPLQRPVGLRDWVLEARLLLGGPAGVEPPTSEAAG